MTIFKTTVWHGSNKNPLTGVGYGINIPTKNYELINRHAKTIELELDNVSCKININDSFWNKCNELKHPEIGKWLIKHNVATWPYGKPPEVMMEKLADGLFRATSVSHR